MKTLYTTGVVRGGFGAATTSDEVLIPRAGTLDYIDISACFGAVSAGSWETFDVKVINGSLPPSTIEDMEMGKMIVGSYGVIRCDTNIGYNSLPLNKFCKLGVRVVSGQRFWVSLISSANVTYQATVTFGLIG